mmetsp:Transcript_13919/g.12473  ORF Transcript_13919/g.12473 Transcript_13919/m.12473 type:complete len:136 (+) Transcript_13919:1-408(+)
MESYGPWAQFKIGYFQSEFKTFVERLNARPNKRHIDISLIEQRVDEEELDFNYSYFVSTDIIDFVRTFYNISHASLRRIYDAFGGEKRIEDGYKTLNVEINWDLDQTLQYHKMVKAKNMNEKNQSQVGEYDYKSN